MLAEEGEYRPGKVPLCAYTTSIGITANEAAENVARLMDLAIERYGRPTEKPFMRLRASVKNMRSWQTS